MKRGGDPAAILALLLALTGCVGSADSAPPPPTIQAVGVATDVRLGQTIMYTFADGTVHEVSASYRQLTDSGWGGFDLIVIGSDSDGPFVSAFPTQEGLPADCYRENAEGIERGAYIETRGVLWTKAANFTSSLHPDVGSVYPGGTRFCFDDGGLITSVIGP